MATNALVEQDATNEKVSQQQSGTGGVALKRLVMVGLAVGVAAFALKQMPDLRRYLKLRSM